MHTLTGFGADGWSEPVTNLGEIGIAASDVPAELVAFWKTRASRPREGRNRHLITGPVHLEGAEPGDVLEVEILDVRPRVPWGVNFTGARSGVLSESYPGYRAGDPPLEQSMIGTFRFQLHKNVAIAQPRAETATHHLIMGLDTDLDRAMRNATFEVVSFLVARYCLRPSAAFSVASVAVDFTVSEAVDGVQVITALIPKSIFPDSLRGREVTGSTACKPGTVAAPVRPEP